MDQAAEFRRIMEEINKNRDSRERRYSETARELAIRYGREQKASGSTYSKIAEDLGINIATLRRWLAPKKTPIEKGAFRRVSVVEQGPAASKRVTLSSGLCIDGLTTNDVIELVKALA